MYHLIPDRVALDQISALSAEALPLLADVFTVLQLVPERGHHYKEELPTGPMRQLVFGPTGNGIVTYLILEDQREVHILLVQWLG